MRISKRIFLIIMCCIMLSSLLPVLCWGNDDTSYDIEDVRSGEGFCEINSLAAASGVGTYFITGLLNVRSGPSTSYTILGQVSYGTRVVVTAVNGNWGKINYKSQTGWISLSYAYKASQKQHTMSAAGLTMLKGFEGFRSTQYWDYSQYSIGYGTACEDGQYPNGITEAKASELLVAALEKYELYLDVFLGEYNIHVTQNQYDALVSFTYNLGNVWNSTKYASFSLKTILIDGTTKYTSAQITAAFGEFVSAGGSVNSGLVTRRNKEAARFVSMTAPSFSDISSSAWYYNAVVYNYNYGMITGTSSVTFSPNVNLTRAMVVTILGKIDAVDTEYYKTSTFNDVAVGTWYTPYVQWAYSEGITRGTGNGKFSPNESVTRQDMITLLYNYTKHTGTSVLVSSSNAYKSFNDASSISSYAITAMNWGVATGCLAGDNYRCLNPKNYTKRSEAAQIIMNFTKKVLVF